MVEFRIRRAVPDDAEVVARLNAFVHDLHVDAHPHYFRPTDLNELSRLFRKWLESPDVAAFLAVDQDEAPVGYVLTKYFDRPATPFNHPRRYVEIDQIVVDPAHRRGGVARTLVAAARTEARARGTDRVHLATWTFNEGAQRFFESEGFVPRATQYWQQLPERD